MSFALSLAHDSRIKPNRLVATTFEKSEEITEDTAENAQQLKAVAVTVLHGVDATKLSSSFGSWLFDTIVFQFPHTGSREVAEGRNPNFILVRDFLKSAGKQLARGGQVLIAAVDSPHYRGAFQFEEAAQIAGFKMPKVYPYKPSQFGEYEHTMTHESGDALANHDIFSLWVFRQ